MEQRGRLEEARLEKKVREAEHKKKLLLQGNAQLKAEIGKLQQRLFNERRRVVMV